jgi:hypothetical protein
MLKLGRTDWRALQWTEDDASEPIQMDFVFAPKKSPEYPQQLRLHLR